MLILVLLSLALYAPTLRNDFVTDDKLQILRNPLVLEGKNLSHAFTGDVWSFSQQRPQDTRIGTNYYRPLQLLVYAAEYQLFGDRPAGWHAVNVLLNAIVASLAYLLIASLASPRLAFWSALLFAMHPIHTEPVAWVAALPELQCALFLLLAILFYHRSRNAASPSFAVFLSALFFLAALFSKEAALLFPFILLGYELFYRPSNFSLSSLAKRLSPALLVLAVYLFARISALGGFAPRHNPGRAILSPWQLFLAVPSVFARYIGKLLLPIHLNYFYTFPLTTSITLWFAAGVLAALFIAIAVWHFRAARPALSFALCWLVLTLAPAFSLNSVGVNFFTERYLYIPSVGFAVVVAAAAVALFSRFSLPAFRSTFYAAITAVFVFCGLQTQRRIALFHDDYTLLLATVRDSPDSYIVQEQLAAAYFDRGDSDSALSHVLRAIQLNPGYVLGHLNAGMYYTQKGNYDAADAQIQEAIRLYPDYSPAWVNLAKVYTLQHNWQLAADAYRRLASLDPSQSNYFLTLASLADSNGKAEAAAQQPSTPGESHDFAGWVRLGDSSSKAGQWPRAAQAYQQAAALQPANATILDKWGVSLLRAGDSTRAIEALRRAVQAQPDSLFIRQALASAFFASNRFADSSAELRKILQANANWEHADQVHLALAVNAEKSGDASTAVQEYQRALSLNPSLDLARQRLAALSRR